MPILLLLLSYAALEVYVFSRVWEAYGFFNTLFALMFAAVIGIGIVRNQGRYVLAKMQQSMAQSQPPSREVLHGVLLLIGGFLFIIPGFISKAIGILLVLPGTRHLIAALVGRRLKRAVAKGMTSGAFGGAFGGPAGHSFGSFRVFTFGSGGFPPGPNAGSFARRPGFESDSDTQVRDVTPLVIDVKNTLPKDKD